MRPIVRLCCLTLLLLSTHKASAQDCNNCNIDSLYKQVAFKKSDNEKVKVLEQVFLNAGPSIILDSVFNQFIYLNKKTKTLNAAPYIVYKEALTLQLQEKYQQSLDKFKIAINGFDKEKKSIPNLLLQIRSLYNTLNQQEERNQFYMEKLNYYLINGPVENTAPCYHGLGGYYVYKGNYDQAISNYLKAAQVYKKFNYHSYMNEIMVVGVEYAAWGNFDKALYYMNKILPWARSDKTAPNLAFPLMALSNINLKRKAYEKALGYADEVLNSYAGKPFSRDYAVATLQKALIFLSQHKAANAYPLLMRAKSVSDTLFDGNKILTQTGTLESNFAWYLYYKEINKKAEAQASLLIAYKEAAYEKSNQMQLKYLRELSQWFTGQNKSGEAKLYLGKYYALNDAIQDEQNAAKIAHYENEQKEQQQAEKINNLRQEKAVQAAVINKSRIIAYISLTALLLISSAMFFIYRQSQINKNTLTKLQQTQSQLIQSEKMASLGELTAGIAHEIQNPLNFVNNFSDVNREMIDELKGELKGGNIDEAIAIADDIQQNEEKINHHGKRADAIVKGMLEHSRASTGQKEPTDINTLADEYLHLAYHGLRAKDKNFNAEVITNFDEALPLANIIPQDMGRVLLNLFNNAFYAVNERRKLEAAGWKPEVTVSTSAANGQVVIVVKDNGLGIPDAIKDKIMQPFFTTKPTGEGTGLGLSLAYDMVVKGHGGRIQVKSVEGEGSEFIISLPIS